MPISHVETFSTWPDGSQKVVSSVYREWNRSPRVNGKLVLRALPLAGIQKVNLLHSSWQPGVTKPPDARNGGGIPPNLNWTSVDNTAYNRWRGKLFKGGASLGVTAASWRQSRDMIVDRSNHLRRTLDSTIRVLERNPGAVKRLRRERQPLANQVLETEFGWRPLFSDMHAALSTVCEDGVPPEWVGGVGRGIIVENTSFSNSDFSTSQSWIGQQRTTYATKVSIDNPNTWLLNRLGLINPATVAWDLVPWSFVANMFVNVNSLLNSFTDTVGLNVTDMSITRTWKLIHDYSYVRKDTYAGCSSSNNVYNKDRTVGVPLKPKIEARIPELNWELCLIASSLVLQKFKTINKIIGIV